MNGEKRRLTRVEVRPLAVADVPVVEAREPSGQGFVRAMWALQQEGESLLLVAWVAGEPVGSAQLDFSASPVELKNLNVHPDTRGQGVGSALVAAAEEIVRRRGRLAMGVGVDNSRARALYERLGYVATGRFSTTTYDYMDASGATRTATETDEMLVKELR